MNAKLSGHDVVYDHPKCVYYFTVKEGVRGINIPVNVTLVGRTAIITLNGRNLTVESAKCILKD